MPFVCTAVGIAGAEETERCSSIYIAEEDQQCVWLLVSQRMTFIHIHCMDLCEEEERGRGRRRRRRRIVRKRVVKFPL